MDSDAVCRIPGWVRLHREGKVSPTKGETGPTEFHIPVERIAAIESFESGKTMVTLTTPSDCTADIPWVVVAESVEEVVREIRRASFDC